MKEEGKRSTWGDLRRINYAQLNYHGPIWWSEGSLIRSADLGVVTNIHNKLADITNVTTLRKGSSQWASGKHDKKPPPPWSRRHQECSSQLLFVFTSCVRHRFHNMVQLLLLLILQMTQAHQLLLPYLRGLTYKTSIFGGSPEPIFMPTVQVVDRLRSRWHTAPTSYHQ